MSTLRNMLRRKTWQRKPQKHKTRARKVEAKAVMLGTAEQEKTVPQNGKNSQQYKILLRDQVNENSKTLGLAKKMSLVARLVLLESCADVITVKLRGAGEETIDTDDLFSKSGCEGQARG